MPPGCPSLQVPALCTPIRAPALVSRSSHSAQSQGLMFCEITESRMGGWPDVPADIGCGVQGDREARRLHTHIVGSWGDPLSLAAYTLPDAGAGASWPGGLGTGLCRCHLPAPPSPTCHAAGLVLSSLPLVSLIAPCSHPAVPPCLSPVFLMQLAPGGGRLCHLPQDLGPMCTPGLRAGPSVTPGCPLPAGRCTSPRRHWRA